MGEVAWKGETIHSSQQQECPHKEWDCQEEQEILYIGRGIHYLHQGCISKLLKEFLPQELGWGTGFDSVIKGDRAGLGPGLGWLSLGSSCGLWAATTGYLPASQAEWENIPNLS